MQFFKKCPDEGGNCVTLVGSIAPIGFTNQSVGDLARKLPEFFPHAAYTGSELSFDTLPILSFFNIAFELKPPRKKLSELSSLAFWLGFSPYFYGKMQITCQDVYLRFNVPTSPDSLSCTPL